LGDVIFRTKYWFSFCNIVVETGCWVGEINIIVWADILESSGCICQIVPRKTRFVWLFNLAKNSNLANAFSSARLIRVGKIFLINTK
jgi:hypothetical protein